MNNFLDDVWLMNQAESCTYVTNKGSPIVACFIKLKNGLIVIGKSNDHQNQNFDVSTKRYLAKQSALAKLSSMFSFYNAQRRFVLKNT